MADGWGIADGYHDVGGTWHETTSESRAALRAAMGEPPPERPVWFVRAGSAPPMQRGATLVLEDGASVDVGPQLPPDLPLGYHDLHPDDGGPTTRLVVVPDRAAPPPERAAGLAAQLYACRSTTSCGIGDLADLATVGRFGAAHGAPFVLVSPLHAPGPAGPIEPSPYFASSRRWRNPLHLRVDGLRDDATDRHIDRDRIWALKRAALEARWAVERDRRPSWLDFEAAGGEDLALWGRFCALAERHGDDWTAWPAGADPDDPTLDERARFHRWVQWLLDEQLAAVAAEVPLVHDLAVGAAPGGFDAWRWRDLLALGARVGAPPDELGPDGQDWGLPPFVPSRLRAAGYEPFASLVRANLAHGAGLRIDHVMGLFRLYWLVDGGAGYVRFPGQELLDVVVLESVRAGTFVVGEDLGTVEPSVREAMAERGLLGYRVGWFEDGAPGTWPAGAVASLTTHDLPTAAGVWSGTDDPTGDFRPRLAALAGDPPADAPVADVVAAAHAALASSPCHLVLGTLEDVVGETERPNVPGTTVERVNWSTALPVPVDRLEDLPTAVAAVESLTSHERGS